MTEQTLWSERAGRSGGPTLLLLHGLGATGGVWARVTQHLAREWPGSWIVCDLPGHGNSRRCRLYSFGAYAAAAAELVAEEEEVVVVGHSLGGMVALALGTHWYGVPVHHVLTLGVKAHWSDEELSAARKRARRPVEWFQTEELALQRFIRVAGLPGNTAFADPLCSRGVRRGNGGYRLAMDPAASPTARAMESPGRIISSMIGATRSSILMACGDKDPVVSIEELRAFDKSAQVITGSGHSPHVERPLEVAELIIKAAEMDSRS